MGFNRSVLVSLGAIVASNQNLDGDEDEDGDGDSNACGQVGRAVIEETETTIEIIDGPYMEWLDQQEIALDLRELMIPDDYFEGLTPDDEDNEGYTGNVCSHCSLSASRIEFVSCRRVVLLNNVRTALLLLSPANIL